MSSPPSPSQFLDTAIIRAEKAWQQSRKVSRCIAIAGNRIQLRFASDTMAQKLFPALQHLLCASSSSSSNADILIWDSAESGISLPFPEWIEQDYLPRGEIREFSTVGHSRLAYQPGSRVLSVFQADTGRGMVWTVDASTLPYWEQAAPLRSLIHWWCTDRDMQLVHGAAVGTERGAVLLTGKGGSGKSTTALGTALNGLDYLGDDYVICQLSEQRPTVHSLYNTAKINPDTLHWLPGIGERLCNPESLQQEKAVLNLAQHYPQLVCHQRPLKAVLLPTVTDSQESTLTPVRPALAMLAISPTTVFQLPGANQGSLKFMKQLVETLPCYQLKLGTDSAQIADLLKRWIEKQC